MHVLYTRWLHFQGNIALLPSQQLIKLALPTPVAFEATCQQGVNEMQAKYICFMNVFNIYYSKHDFYWEAFRK